MVIMKTNVIVTGDVHGDFGALNKLISKKKKHGLKLIIACGDFGVWPQGSDKVIKGIKTQGVKIIFCDGNHENHHFLINRKSDEIVPGVFYMPRGSTYKLDDGRNILFMGGANSIDKQWRTPGFDWFPEEIISQKDMENLPNEKVDIFITHTCPTELLHDMLKVDSRKWDDPSNHYLSELWKKYKPSLHYFGHWHTYKTGILMGTRWYCLNMSRHTNFWRWLD
jgi:Icc-related predicted phosphoesterase